MKSEAEGDVARRVISKKGKRQTSSECSVAVASHVTDKADGEKRRKKRFKKQRKLKRNRGISRSGVNNDSGKVDEGQVIPAGVDMLVLKLLEIFYKSSFKHREKMCALVLVAVFCTIYTVCLYSTPYLSVLTTFFLFYSYRCDGSKLLSSYCSGNGRRVGKRDIIFFHALQCSEFFVLFIIIMCLVVICSAFKNTVTNALWNTDSVVSMQELQANFTLSYTYWRYVFNYINYTIKRFVFFILWL